MVGLDAAPPDPAAAAPPAKAEVLTVDVRDEEAVRAAVGEVRPEVGYHLAAEARGVMSMRDRAAAIEEGGAATVERFRAHPRAR